MSRIILSEIAKGNIKNCKPYQQNKTENYLKLQKEADAEIELDRIQKAKAEIAARNYVCT
jgi:hypothetical protein